MHQALQGGTFHVEHITPRVRGGASTLYQTMMLPTKFIGVGEALDDLQPFDVDTFVESLFIFTGPERACGREK
jgi:signal recognition particle GTPase